jgi:hypothetical protein
LDSERLNRWLTLVANAGVLVGIALVAVELNQNRQMIQAQTRNEITQGTLDLLNYTATNMALSNALVRANRGEELSDTENLMVGSRNEAVLRHWENIHYQYRQGLYDQSEFDASIATFSAILSKQPALMNEWCLNRLSYSVEFATELGALLPPDSC